MLSGTESVEALTKHIFQIPTVGVRLVLIDAEPKELHEVPVDAVPIFIVFEVALVWSLLAHDLKISHCRGDQLGDLIVRRLQLGAPPLASIAIFDSLFYELDLERSKVRSKADLPQDEEDK